MRKGCLFKRTHTGTEGSKRLIHRSTVLKEERSKGGKDAGGGGTEGEEAAQQGVPRGELSQSAERS